MGGRLAKEMQQKGFTCLEEEAALNILRTAEVLLTQNASFLKPYGLTPTQFNVLRILRGAGGAGLACSEVGERLIKHDPDITRLLLRMQTAGLISRKRSTTDRRVVIARITPEALKLLNRTDQPQTDLLKNTLGPLGEPVLKQLIVMLEDLRRASC